MFWKVFVLLVGIFIIGVWKTYFLSNFYKGLVSLMIFFGCWPLVVKRTCIKGGFHDVHALFHIAIHSVHARCLIKCFLGIFLTCLDSDEYQTLGFLMFLH